jgi:hypothetical protein
MNNSVPAREYVKQNVEKVLILENPFCPVGEKIFGKTTYTH